VRTVAILGRPNVGKSTLFNRLVGRRQAIVDPTPGVTRDRLEGKGNLAGLEFRVIDTAGIEDPEREDDLKDRLRRQTMAGLAEADVGLFMIDARAGLTAADRDIADLLRRQREKPIVLLANKAEGGAAQMQAQEAWGLGLGVPIPISAREGDGFADLFAALLPIIEAPEDESQVPAEAEPSGAAPEEAGSAGEGPTEDEADEDDDDEVVVGGFTDEADEPAAEEERDEQRPMRLAIVGRPNVGKSSLVNRLLDEERLLTGPEPGLTRDAVRVGWEWQGRRIELVDTAGLRRRAKVELELEKLSTGATIHALKMAEVVVLVVDATQALERQDLTIARLIVKEGRALVLAVNKWDLIDEPQAALAEIRRLIGYQLADVQGVEVVTLSALTGRGLGRLLPAVVAAHERWSRRVSTGALNRALAAALERHMPPLAGGRRIKIRYGTQTTARPPTFVLFTNKPAGEMPESYVRYLIGAFRESFDLAGVPIRVHLRQGKNPYADERD
jgi:GTP-binding protein